jgi:alpha-mannosidase
MHCSFGAVESTDLFVGSAGSALQVVRITLERVSSEPLPVEISGRGVSGRGEIPAGDGPVTIEVGVAVEAAPGEEIPVEIIARRPDGAVDRVTSVLRVERPGYTMHLVSHFHYDPVWWNTQAAYTSSEGWFTDDGGTRPLWEHNGFALVDAHLDLALRDPDYRFVLAEIDYLKPYFDVHPERRADLRQLLAAGRVELLGGTYNEPNTNLTGAELTIRNIVYGVGYQRDILHGDPVTAWQLDVFGHDPQFPGYLAAAGLTGSAWARGPFHQWGPMLKTFGVPKGDATVMQFPSEFEWIAPSGAGVLTHYMPNHYSAGWAIDSAPTLADAEQATYELYRGLKPVSATRHILLPVGTDYTPPNKWITEIHRSWNARYVWPRFVTATPRDFLAAVRAESDASGIAPSPQTRDMNPLYTGKDVSYIDTKQAQRAGEIAVTDAEKLATLAGLLGLGHYPDAALDKAWRLLAYGAHHDAVTGTESDQVYIDLLAGWREAYDLASSVRDTSLDAIAAKVDTSGPGRAVVVANTLSFDRSDLVRIADPGPSVIVDDTGAPVESVRDRGDLVFRADAVPALGWRTFRLVDDSGSDWAPADGLAIANEHYRVTSDPAQGGAVTSIVQLPTGRELLRGPGNELRCYDEYPQHPEWGEGPWHLLPTGTSIGSATGPATVRRMVSGVGERLLVTGTVDGLVYEQTITLWQGLDRVDFRTRVLDFAGSDKLVRVRFPVDLPGALPVSEVASAVVGRGYAFPDVDTAASPWTLDNPANGWFGLGSTARVELRAPDGTALGARAIGIAEVVVGGLEQAGDVRDLVVALARAGVTATTSAADWARYGWLAVDSNLPDVRIVVGGPERNAFAAELLERAGAGVRAEYDRQLAEDGQVVLWVPAERSLTEVWQADADLRDARALPALLIVGESALAAVVADAADARIGAVSGTAPAEPLTDGTVALLTYGLPGFAVDPTGALHLSLLRSCTGWPSGVWLDPPRRTAPDGTSFQLQHWTHEFEYALVAGDGDWRSLTLPARGQEYSTPLLGRVADAHPGPLPPTESMLQVEPAREVLLSALKPTGNPIATGSAVAADVANGVSLRLSESTGLGNRMTLRGPLAPAFAQHADLLERPLPGRRSDGYELTGFELATLLARPQFEVLEPDAAPLGPATEPAQPVFARYWAHNRGPAPMGYLPISVAVTPGIRHSTGDPIEVEVVLASELGDRAHEGLVTIQVPDGWKATPDTRVYRLPPDGHDRFPVLVTPSTEASAGQYFVAARIEYGGQSIEDVTTVLIGDPAGRPGSPRLVPQSVAEKGTQLGTAVPTGLIVEASQPELRLRPGSSASFNLVLTNTTQDEIRGEIQLVSPWGSWDYVPRASAGIRLPAGQRHTEQLPVTVPAGAEGGHSWLLAKVMWFGRCQYSPAIRLIVDEIADRP